MMMMKKNLRMPKDHLKLQPDREMVKMLNLEPETEIAMLKEPEISKDEIDNYVLTKMTIFTTLTIKNLRGETYVVVDQPLTFPMYCRLQF